MRVRTDRISSVRPRKKLARSTLLALAVCACGGAITTPSPGETFRLHLGESARVEGTSLVVTFWAVLEDTRCPVDVVCILAGNGRVRLEVRGVPGAGHLVLNTTGEPRESPVGGFRIRLHDLLPDRLVGRPIPPEAYEVDLEVVPN
ncbi:MAG: hypothetical protein ACREMR_00665 [Gemmatimonadales bacterium]